MKTMTCKQLGGACDLQLRGETADEVIMAQDKHLREAVAAGDAEVVQEPTEQPYGVRDCAVRDPSGNLVRVQEVR